MRTTILRYAAAFIVALAALLGLLLLVRPLIFTFSSPRDDTVYAVAATGEIGETPRIKELLLNEPHGLHGERPNGVHAAIAVVISRTLGGQFSVVNAWSPVHGCLVTVAADRLRDCRGSTWTFSGEPISPGDPALQRFPVRVENGAVIVDFTRPVAAAR
jgi:hypothetical protein